MNDTVDYSKYRIEFIDGNNVSRQAQLTKDMVSGLDLTTVGTRNLKVTYLGVTVNVSYTINAIKFGKYKVATEYWLDDTLQTTIISDPNVTAYIIFNSDGTAQGVYLPDTTRNTSGTWEINGNKLYITFNGKISSTTIDGNGRITYDEPYMYTSTITNNGTTYNSNKQINYLVYFD
jgi:hypothetical protein